MTNFSTLSTSKKKKELQLSQTNMVQSTYNDPAYNDSQLIAIVLIGTINFFIAAMRKNIASVVWSAQQLTALTAISTRI